MQSFALQAHFSPPPLWPQMLVVEMPILLIFLLGDHPFPFILLLLLFFTLSFLRLLPTADEVKHSTQGTEAECMLQAGAA